MEDANSGRPPAASFHHVRDAAQARLLSDTDALRYFDPFLARELSASQAAAEVGCALDTMLYRIRRFLDAGLLEVTHLEKRAGRPIKHYRSSADAYFIPFEMTPFTDLQERLEGVFTARQKEIAQALAGLLRDAGWLGTRVYRDATGTVWRDAARDVSSDYEPENPDVPAVMQSSMDIYLPHEEAKALQLQLVTLFRHYQARYSDKGQGKRYALDLTFLPLAPE